jgi:hypothetical protein
MKKSKTKFRRGDRVQSRVSKFFGEVVEIKERGVAGCAVTYVEWIRVVFENGSEQRGQPEHFILVEND